ncbi:unnamed protein product [Lampetra fluviatilis]
MERFNRLVSQLRGVELATPFPCHVPAVPTPFPRRSCTKSVPWPHRAHAVPVPCPCRTRAMSVPCPRVANRSAALAGGEMGWRLRGVARGAAAAAGGDSDVGPPCSRQG